MNDESTRRLAPLTNRNCLIYRTTRYARVGCWFCAEGSCFVSRFTAYIARGRVSRWKGRNAQSRSLLASRKSPYSFFRVKGPAHLHLMTNIFRGANVSGAGETTCRKFYSPAIPDYCQREYNFSLGVENLWKSKSVQFLLLRNISIRIIIIIIYTYNLV